MDSYSFRGHGYTYETRFMVLFPEELPNGERHPSQIPRGGAGGRDEMMPF